MLPFCVLHNRPMCCFAATTGNYLLRRMQVQAVGKAILGYAVLGPVALLLLAEATRVSCVLPGQHDVMTVTLSRWHRIQLQVRVHVCGCV